MVGFFFGLKKIPQRPTHTLLPDIPAVLAVVDAQFGRVVMFAHDVVEPRRIVFDVELIIIAGVNVELHAIRLREVRRQARGVEISDPFLLVELTVRCEVFAGARVGRRKWRVDCRRK